MSISSRLPGKKKKSQHLIAHVLPSQKRHFGFVLSVAFWFLFCFVLFFNKIDCTDKR